VSDGSTDDTVLQVKEFASRHPTIAVTTLELAPQQGRASAHNAAVASTTADIVIFTDAETEFTRGFLRSLCAEFEDSRVGFATGELRFRNETLGNTARSAGMYWRLERHIRALESALGILAVGSGACCAVRRELFRPIPLTGDVDFTTPIDVILQGLRCVHCADAVALETLPDTPTREFRTRVRMTAKNFYGTLSRLGWKGVFQRPFHTLGLLSHKIGRWLTPFFLITLLLTNIVLAPTTTYFALALLVQVLFYGAALAGFLGVKHALAMHAYSFVLVNVGFALGVLKALVGSVPGRYVPVRQS